jgi:hypothetical protein
VTHLIAVGSIERRCIITRTLLALVAGAALLTATAWTGTPVDRSGPATSRDYAELFTALQEVQTSLDEFETAVAASTGKWQKDCRNYSPAKTVKCAAVKFQPPGGMREALGVWNCESGFGHESPHSDSYHGPFQYMYLTYEHQQESMPNVVRWYELSAAVHDMRSNIMTAVAWAARHGWGPWSCA